jgi:hypothetical protein
MLKRAAVGEFKAQSQGATEKQKLGKQKSRNGAMRQQDYGTTNYETTDYGPQDH